MALQPKSHWLAALEAAKVPCGPINSLAEVFSDPQVNARQMVDTWQHPLADDVRLVASPMKLSETPVLHGAPPPMLGEHTEQILADVLGMEPSAVLALKAQGIVA